MNGHVCSHLAARHPVSGGRFELWIDRTHLIRRIFRPATASYDLTGTRIDYSPDLTTTPPSSLFETASFD